MGARRASTEATSTRAWPATTEARAFLILASILLRLVAVAGVAVGLLRPSAGRVATNVPGPFPGRLLAEAGLPVGLTVAIPAVVAQAVRLVAPGDGRLGLITPVLVLTMVVRLVVPRPVGVTRA